MPSFKTSVSLDPDLAREAREYGINVSELLRENLEMAVRAERTRRWVEQNRDGIEAYNRWVERNGLPFADRRAFFRDAE